MAAPKPVVNQTLLRTTTGSVIRINASFLMASLMGWIAWFTWPLVSSAIGWAVVSFMCGIIAVSMLIRAMSLIVKLYWRDRTIAAYVQQGARPKTSELASEDALKNAGMR